MLSTCVASEWSGALLLPSPRPARPVSSCSTTPRHARHAPLSKWRATCLRGVRPLQGAGSPWESQSQQQRLGAAGAPGRVGNSLGRRTPAQRVAYPTPAPVRRSEPPRRPSFVRPLRATLAPRAHQTSLRLLLFDSNTAKHFPNISSRHLEHVKETEFLATWRLR